MALPDLSGTMVEDPPISDADRGKVVVSPGGEALGRVVHVRGDDVYVDVEPGLTAPVRSRLGWASEGGTYRLDESAIDDVTDDEVRLDL